MSLPLVIVFASGHTHRLVSVQLKCNDRTARVLPLQNENNFAVGGIVLKHLVGELLQTLPG